MGKIVVKNAVKRRPGYLYYVDGNGNVCETAMSRKGPGKKTDRKKKKTAKKAVKKVTRKPAKKKPTKKKKR